MKTMFATGHPRRNHPKVWQIFFCLALLSFLFRSMVPAGYMPGAVEPHDRILAITLCDAFGVSSLQITAPAAPAPHSSGHDGTSHACPFCSVVTQAIAPGAGMPAIVAAVMMRSITWSRQSALPLATAVAGPPLGPRAPPPFLG